MTDKRENKKGFIALMSAIIISVILLLIITGSSFGGFYSRFNILESEFKERSSALAEACVDVAILNIVNNPSYTGDATTTVNAKDNCYVGTVTTSGGQKIFETRGIYSNSHTNLKVTVNSTSFSITSVEELPVF